MTVEGWLTEPEKMCYKQKKSCQTVPYPRHKSKLKRRGSDWLSNTMESLRKRMTRKFPLDLIDNDVIYAFIMITVLDKWWPGEEAEMVDNLVLQVHTLWSYNLFNCHQLNLSADICPHLLLWMNPWFQGILSYIFSAMPPLLSLLQICLLYLML